MVIVFVFLNVTHSILLELPSYDILLRLRIRPYSNRVHPVLPIRTQSTHLQVVYSRITTTMDLQETAEAATKAKDFHEKLKVEVENIIFQTLPERMVHLYELLNMPEHRIPANYIEYKFEAPSWSTTMDENIENNDICAEEEEIPAVRDTIPAPRTAVVPSNKNVTEIFEVFKPRFLQLAKDSRAIKMWLTLSVPKIEDGDNFGVFVQKNVLSMLQEVEEATVSYFGKVTSYYDRRGKLVAKAVKYPFIEDYRVAVEELDEKQYTEITLCIHDIYFCYTLLYDVIVKNFEKIKNPRPSNGGSMTF